MTETRTDSSAVRLNLFRRISFLKFVCLIPFLFWIGFLLVLPQIQLLVMSFMKHRDSESGFYLGNYIRFFSDQQYLYIFARTAVYALVTTLITLIIVYPVAFYLAKVASGTAKKYLILVLLLPFWISELVRTYSWMIMLREAGIINYLLVGIGALEAPVEMLYNDGVILLGLVYGSMLYMLLSIYGVLESLDDSLIEAAMDLGANRWSVFKEIIWPYSYSGVTSGCIIVFMMSVGNFAIPSLLGGKNSLYFTETIYNQFMMAWNWNQGSAFGFLLLLLSTFIIWAGLRITKQRLSEVSR